MGWFGEEEKIEGGERKRQGGEERKRTGTGKWEGREGEETSGKWKRERLGEERRGLDRRGSWEELDFLPGFCSWQALLGSNIKEKKFCPEHGPCAIYGHHMVP